MPNPHRAGVAVRVAEAWIVSHSFSFIVVPRVCSAASALSDTLASSGDVKGNDNLLLHFLHCSIAPQVTLYQYSTHVPGVPDTVHRVLNGAVVAFDNAKSVPAFQNPMVGVMFVELGTPLL